MRIILEVDDTTVALSITAMRMYGIETSIGAHCLDIQGADGKVIVIPKEGKAEIKEADEDAGTEVRHGRWIAVSSLDACGGDEEAWMAHGNPTAYHYCSECKNETYLNEEGKEILSDYCPFCGADMREVSEDAGTAE